MCGNDTPGTVSKDRPLRQALCARLIETQRHTHYQTVLELPLQETPTEKL